ncbi:uncharacterized protein LOC131433557 isoform X1 [Malaya genurostris]|uniref:uncharacterized protein LOC131433557 isoform X1 n=1 Tax=Malaya genurostris TaxID=325434 RepID=UPI0026F3D645|nr:uncharacterized protein LOC131433557 isoform X1 [Malaya genurostris]
MNCFICKDTICSLPILMHHVTVFHGTPINLKYECTNCVPKMAFQDKHRFKRHVVNAHSILFEPQILKEKPIEDSASYIHLNNILAAPDNYQCKEPRKSVDNIIDSKNDNGLVESDIIDIINKLRESFLNFTLTLYSKKNFARKDVVELQKNISAQIVRPICDALTKVSYIPKENIYEELLQEIYNPFQFVATEHKFNNELKNLNLIENPQTIEFKDKNENVISRGCLMPIKYQIRKFFENGNVFHESIHNMQLLEHDNNIKNFVKGSLWCDIKQEFKDKIVVPYFLFSDEAELNDAIGAHSGTHKVCGLYYTFPIIPAHFLAKLCNIFVAGFIKAKDINEFGPSCAFKELIDVLVDLEKNGICLEIRGVTTKVHFVLAGLLGDNLGINTIMGYATSFNSMFYCRFCRISKNQAQIQIQLDPGLNRNKQNYNEDALKAVNESGIKDYSSFNRLQHYHVGEFTIVDPMHDLYSHGICHYDLALVLKYMIETMKISLHTINYRIQMFKYGEIEKRNTFRKITREHIKTSSFKMTAREMMHFLHFFPLIFGDIIPENDKVWKFVLSLIELADLILLPRFNDELLITLQKQISLHHTLYKELFNEKLKPKYHILLHYVSTIRKVGPPRYTWSFRFEAFHQSFKQYCRTITSRRNICLTLCIKAGLIFSQDSNNSRFFQQDLNYKKVATVHLANMPYFSLLEINSTLLSSSFHASSTVSYKGTEYKRGYFLTKSDIDISNLKLFEIRYLLVKRRSVRCMSGMDCIQLFNTFRSF